MYKTPAPAKYETLLGEMKDYLNKRREIPRPLFERLSKLMYWFNVIPISPNKDSCGINKLILKLT